jgi:hypothetical protein
MLVKSNAWRHQAARRSAPGPGPRRQDANRTEADDDGALENNGVAVALHRVPHAPTRLAAAVTHTHVDVPHPHTRFAPKPSIRADLVGHPGGACGSDRGARHHHHHRHVACVCVCDRAPVWVRWWLMCSRLLA